MVTHSDQLVPVGMLGAFVSPLVQTHQTGKVMGITSRGIFLLFDHRVFFLTAENHENPFMIHIPHLADLPRQSFSTRRYIWRRDTACGRKTL